MKKEKIICKEKIAIDFQEGKELLENLENNITIFGSARTKENDKYALLAQKLAFRLSQNGINIITGGGDGIMRSANKGAFEAKTAESIGLSISLPFENSTNEYTTKNLMFNYFFSRKYMLVRYSKACVIFPGGFGTLDELFEVLTLTQTGKMNGFKIYLFGTDYWKYLVKFIKKSLYKQNMIDKKDLDIFTVTDSIKLIEKEIKQLIK